MTALRLRVRPHLTLLLSLFLALTAGCRSSDRGQRAGDLPAGHVRLDGLLELELDRARGHLWWVLPQDSESGRVLARLLLVEGITTGLGSNAVGLDRGSLGPARVVALRRVGGRLVVEAENHRYRAESEDAAEVRAARESFATSVLWAGPVVVRGGGLAVVDLAPFVARDAHGVARTLADAGQGTFRLDDERSTLDPARCFVFQDNVELEALLTFTSDRPGSETRTTAPDGAAVSLVQHVSLVRLPQAGYEPRPHDPRSGAMALRYQNHAAPPGRSVDEALALRFRLHKQDPGAAISEPVKPIVFHVDRGAPEPVRSALLEGARWWELAFREAGFPNGFKVELLPEDAHPLDARYNVIQWVHRSTRGWSYGNPIVDPRTGEIVKAQVTLGSQRIRHDVLLLEALAGIERSGTGAPDDPVELALDRIRQLSAHEVGHALGLVHNFAASTYGDRASVMDYPAPLVRVGADGELDFSQAYARGVGAWDVVAIRWLYEQPPTGVDTGERLNALLADAEAAGHRFLTDADARGAAAAHPQANLWDNGANALPELREVLAVRAHALGRFGKSELHSGQPAARLGELLTPLYLYHRYQLEAAARLIGGVFYDHAVQGGFRVGRTIVVDGELQRRAHGAVLATLEPAFLDVPEDVLARLVPAAPGSRAGERLESRAGAIFDLVAAAETAADLALAFLLEPTRCARVVEQHARFPERQPALEELFQALLRSVYRAAPAESPRERELRRAVQRLTLQRLCELADSAAAAPQVRWRAEAQVRELGVLLGTRKPGDEVAKAFNAELLAEVERFLARDHSAPATPARVPSAPPGPPIGAAGLQACGHD